MIDRPEFTRTLTVFRLDIDAEKLRLDIGDTRWLLDPAKAIELADELQRAAAFLSPALFPFRTRR